MVVVGEVVWLWCGGCLLGDNGVFGEVYCDVLVRVGRIWDSVVVVILDDFGLFLLVGCFGFVWIVYW